MTQAKPKPLFATTDKPKTIRTGLKAGIERLRK